MKKTGIGLLALIGVVILLACDTYSYDVPYYKFTKEDKALLIKYDYKPDQTITYENQHGEQLHFKVLLNETKKRGYYSRGTFSGGGGHLMNHYDSKIIRIEILQNPSYEEYAKVNYIFSRNFDTLVNGINFPMWNRTEFNFINELQDKINIPMEDFNALEKTRMNINGHWFQQVVQLNSNSEEILQAYAFGPLVQNVNKIYYDYDFGLVQFEAVDGTVWKVIYPE